MRARKTARAVQRGALCALYALCALLVACAASPPQESGAEAAAAPEPLSPVALSEPVAYQVLADARWLALPDPPPNLLRRPYVLDAFDMLLNAPDARPAFERLLRDGSSAGKLYAIAGLYHFDPRGAQLMLQGLEDSASMIRVGRGTSIAAAKVGDLVAADGLAPLTSDRAALQAAQTRQVRSLLADRPVEHWVAMATGEDGDSVALARAVLGLIGEPAVRPLLDHAREAEDPDQRMAAYAALAWIGPRARDVVPELQELVEVHLEDRPRQTLGAVSALAGIGPWARPALPRLKQLLAAEPRLDDPISRRQLKAAIGAIE